MKVLKFQNHIIYRKKYKKRPDTGVDVPRETLFRAGLRHSCDTIFSTYSIIHVKYVHELYDESLRLGNNSE